MRNIAILVSGSGSNAENIIKQFMGSDTIKVKLLLSNKSDAPAIEKARRLAVPTFTFSADEFRNSTLVDQVLENAQIDYVILAGFLLLVPARIVEKFSGRIINIHPALLPSYGGKGMYGANVHKAVVAAGENETGITIHQVNEHFDKGAIIFQARVSIDKCDTPTAVAEKVQELEQQHFPRVIEEYIMNNKI